MSQSQSPLDDLQDYVESLLRDPTLSNADIVRTLKGEGIATSETALRRAAKRWGVTRPQSNFEKPGTRRTGDEATLISTPVAELRDAEQLMIERGFDPEEWEIIDATVNEWEGAPVRTDQKQHNATLSSEVDEEPKPLGNRLYRQLKIRIRKKKEIQLLAPAEPSGFKRPKVRASKPPEGGYDVVFTGDQQAPYFDPQLHAYFCEWLRVNKPAKGVLIGDTVDFPDISRHRLRPETNATVQQCINAGYYLLRDYVDASPDTEWIKLCGNHDERIRNTLIDYTAELYGIKRAEIEGKPESSVLSIDHLLRLDELGIHYVDPGGSYDQAQLQITPYLAARHGWIARKGSGASALKTLEHLGYSIIVGHTHRQSLVHKTTHDIGGKPTTLAGVETGCMCLIEDGLGYAVAPDWQNGFATAHVWPDGKFKIDLATYVSGQLMWRDQRYG